MIPAPTYDTRGCRGRRRGVRVQTRRVSAYPPAPPPPQPAEIPDPPPPRALRPVVVLLIINLALSIVLTVAVLVARDSVVNYQLAHRHIADPATRETVRKSLVGGLWGRVAGNIIASVIYVFLVRALFRGRRWAYRRVLLLGTLGIVSLVLIQLSPYPTWMRAEQLTQAAVLAVLLWFTTRPEVRSHFAKGLPGRGTRRFRSG
jgi:hypothetical protein